MRKWIGILLLIAGVIFISVAGYNLWLHDNGQDYAIHKAEAIVKDTKNQQDRHSRKFQMREKFDPAKGESIGILKIPKLDIKLPIIEGTDPEQLVKGVGHYRATAFPGGDNQILLSGHRDTVFRRLGELQSGDKIIVQLPYGTFRYVMKDSEVVSADDTTVIRSTAPKEVLTLSTCYPFNYIGNAPKRYVINAHPEGKLKINKVVLK
ncbi:class D sortase [Pseudalkalibacillus decolorationis]|uniref:class D sortase n=1 Tax=Pseudalkalibacillus decolorationis TaxID=163879 RepID=UPI002147C42F|nr:class D sortase [Pseudalkalibacillus decolorationis]